MAGTNVLHLRYAKRGDGTTVMDGATRARLIGNLDSKRSQAGGVELPSGDYKVGGAPQAVIESENFADVLAAMHGTLDAQVLVLGYADGTASGRKLTAKFATATQVGDSEFPPMEGGQGSVPRYQITLDLHAGDGVTTLAHALVDAADS